MGANAAILIEALLQLTLKAADYAMVIQRAKMEGRDVPSDELAQASASAQAAIDALKQQVNVGAKP